jgi:hypothetical protein
MWYLLTLVVMICMSLSWWALWYVPSKTTLARMQGEYEELVRQQVSMNSINKTVDELHTVVQELSKTIKNNIHDHEAHRIRASHLLAFISDAGLVLLDYSPKELRNKDGFLFKSIELHLAGSFSEVEKFFKSLAAHEYSVLVEHLKITPHKSLLDVRCTINIMEALDERIGSLS